MSPRTTRLWALASTVSLLAAGCTQLSPAENNGVFSGANAQLAAGDLNRASTAMTAGQFATGAPTSATTVAVTAIIVKHQATVRQRQIAEQRARATYARLVSQRTNFEAASRPVPTVAKRQGVKPPSRHVASVYQKPSARKLPRYIAVETAKDEHTAPKAQKAVMIWDTETQEIVGNNVYDIATTPPVGATSRFEMFSAEYVGAGL